MTAVTLDREPTPWKPLFRERRFIAESSLAALVLSFAMAVAHWKTGALGPGTIAAIAYAAYASFACNIDIRVLRLPNVFTTPATALALAWVVGLGALTNDWKSTGLAVLCAVISFALWWGLAIVLDIGYGDVKFVVAGSLLLGYEGWGVWAMGSFVWLVALMVLQVLITLMAGKSKDASIPQGPSFALAAILGLAFPLMFAI